METLLDRSRLDNYISNLNDETLNGDFDVIFRDAPLPKDSFCGIGPLRGRFLHKFANKKSFIFVFGVVGLILSSSHAYYNGTITTMEKRFKIPSKNMGFIATGNDITGFFLSMFIAYYGGRGHRPRWMALGILTIVIYCLMNVIPHFLYGPGEDALKLTVEYGAVKDDDKTKEVQEMDNNLLICQRNVTEADSIPCQRDDGNIVAQIYLFGAQLVAGVGQTLKHTLGISYLDDNIKKSKTPALISLSYFIRLLGPAAGYALASLSLKLYIAPELTPVISNDDPRWLGAWYLGWIFIALVLLSFTVIMAMFPRELPRAAVRKRIALEKQKRSNANKFEVAPLVEEEAKASVKDFYITLKRLLANKVFMLNNFAGIFYVFGFMPFWIFSPKLIETLFKQSSSASSLFTGTFALVSSAAGLLVAGYVISKYKPSARYLAFWNVIVGVLSVISVLSFSFMGCEEGQHSVHGSVDVAPCNTLCNCDFVKYSPVCGADGITYISACHAGCTQTTMFNKTKTFADCACIDSAIQYEIYQDHSINPSQALSGPCPVDCSSKLVTFLIVICFMKFIGASGRASNFLVGIRCVEERDKTLAIGLGMTLLRLLAAVPSPIVFGYIIDNACIAWGKTCTRRGNCWLYDSEKLRYSFFYASTVAIAIATIFDALVWKHCKNLQIFEEDDKINEKIENISVTNK